MDDQRRHAGLADRFDQREQGFARFLIVDADAALHRHRHGDRRAHRRDGLGDQ